MALLAISALVLPPPSSGQQRGSEYTFKAQSELVLVNVTVRDKNGNPVRDLKPDDFTVLEDNKPQKVATFDIENTQSIPRLPMHQANLLARRPKQLRVRPPVLPLRASPTTPSRTAG